MSHSWLVISEKKPDYSDTPSSNLRIVYPRVAEDLSEQPFVSIVTPYFNSGRYFHETEKCIRNQSFQQWEWIIVNDGSTEPEVLERLESLRSRDSRIRIINHQQNSGPSAARNSGYREAQSSLVFQLDSDDLLEPTAIEKLVWYLLSHPEHSFVGSFHVGFQENAYVNTNGFHVRERFLLENSSITNVLVRKSVHDAVGGFNEEYRDGLEDWDFWLKCADTGYWGGTVPEFLVWYRWRDRPLDRWKNWGDPRLREKFREQMRAKYPKIYAGVFPTPTLEMRGNRIATGEVPGLRNFLVKETRRVVLIASGEEQDLESIVSSVAREGTEVSLLSIGALSNEKLHELSKLTPEVFALPNFLRREEVLRFFTYFIRSRGADLIVFGNTPLTYRLHPAVVLSLPGARSVDTTPLGGLTPDSIKQFGV